MILSKLQPDQDKFSHGLGTLWRGFNPLIDIGLIKDALLSPPHPNLLPFFSARKAIYWILCSYQRLYPDKTDVLISAFTCEAVVQAILESGLNPKYVKLSADLTYPLNYQTLITDRTLLVVLQHTLGVECVPQSENSIPQGIPVIHDFCLSPGHNLESWKAYVDQYDDQYILFSYEYSKSLTIGQGGSIYASFNSIHFLLASGYNYTSAPSSVLQLKILFGSFASSLFSSRFSLGYIGPLVWAFFVATGLILRSNYLPPKLNRIIRAGSIQSKFIHLLFQISPSIARKQASIIDQLLPYLQANQFLVPLLPIHLPSPVSAPRLGFYVLTCYKEQCVLHFSSYQIKLGQWFNSCDISETVTHELSHMISLPPNVSVLNLPTYSTLRPAEISMLIQAIRSFKPI